MKIREQVQNHGIASLTIEQLFILVVGSGTKNHHVEQIVHHLAYLSNNFSDLTVLKSTNLLNVPG
ncbi:hypothetical protein EQ500_07335, partial [Lactobacillus sp. XV13L]|nr:hypothetical protein [Lactobacillus sp. XV13L]